MSSCGRCRTAASIIIYGGVDRAGAEGDWNRDTDGVLTLSFIFGTVRQDSNEFLRDFSFCYSWREIPHHDLPLTLLRLPACLLLCTMSIVISNRCLDSCVGVVIFVICRNTTIPITLFSANIQ